jgi:hypothetical protein
MGDLPFEGHLALTSEVLASAQTPLVTDGCSVRLPAGKIWQK